MAKKITTKKSTQKTNAWGDNFKMVSEKISEAKRKNRYVEEPHVPKIPRATIFANGQKIILNG